MKSFRHFTKRFFLILHLAAAVLCALTSLIPLISPSRYWLLGFLGLALPLVVGILLLFILFWLVFDPKYALISVVALLAGWKCIGVCFALHPDHSHRFTRIPGSITLLSYNVHYFTPYDDRPDKKNQTRSAMLELIRDQHPDIACFQEFFNGENSWSFNYRAYFSDSLGLHYQYFNADYHYGNGNYSGVILFSRFPILKSGKIRLMDSINSETAVFADILAGGDTFRVFTMHLESIHLTSRDLQGIALTPQGREARSAASRNVFVKLRRAFLKRGLQADRMAAEIRQSPYPVIVCGDFNDTPDSYTYFTIRSKLQDAFLEKGWGAGRTYRGISPTLRIDYILADRRFQVHHFDRIPRDLSDHYPIICNLSLGADR